jgi:protein TonB
MKNYLLKFLFLLLLFPFSLSAQEYMKKKKGTYKKKYANGMLQETGPVKDHFKTGEWKNYFLNGQLKSVYNYEHGVLNGPYVVYQGENNKAEEGTYTHGIKTGENNAWYYNGKPKFTYHYDQQGKETGLQQTWNANGDRASYILYRADGSKEVIRYSAGLVSSKMNFLNEKLEGTQYYYSSGFYKYTYDTLPYKIETYHNNMLEGPFLEYGNRHILLLESYYKNDKLDSVYRAWNSDGTPKCEFYYKDGIQNGPCVNYRNGKKMTEGNFLDGKQSGLQTQYQFQFCYMWYTNDERDSSKCFFPDKKLQYYYKMVDPTERLLKGTEYDSLGRIVKECFIKKNISAGQTHYYYPNGKVKSEFEYVNGIPAGSLKAWSPKGKPVMNVTLDQHANSYEISIWSDAGVQLQPGTEAFNAQLKKYLPSEFYFNETEGNINGGYFDEAPPQVIEPTADKEQKKQEDVYMFAEEMPSYPDFSKYLATNIKYPEEERTNGKHGTVYVSFIVEKDGSITNVKIVKEVAGAPGFSKEAIRVIAAMPNWTPGKMNGRPVRVQMTQPIKFVL